MIEGNVSLNGVNVENLPFNSRELIAKICDSCGNIKNVSWNTVIRCRKKHNTNLDYCFKCSMKIYNTGENNSAKRPDVKKKMSLSMKGKSKIFKDGKNLRILDRRISTSGHVLKWDESLNSHLMEHRLVMSKYLNKPLDQLNEIHHINGIKTDNDISNLIELSSSEHGSLHSQLEKLAFDLVNKNLIIFDKLSKTYVLSPTLLISSMEKSLGFENIAIKQKKNICKSRLDVNIESEVIRGVKLQIPIIAANMSTVVNSEFCIKLYKLGGLGILHRADSEENLIKSTKKVAKECHLVPVSIGIDNNQFDLAKLLIKNGANIVTIDIAHGYSDSVLELAKKIKHYSSDTKIIIGNTTNPDIIYECYDFVDAIKVGIAQGLACETKNTAGCTEKQFSTVLKFKTISRNFGIPIISDGGIREPADFTKSIAAGANSIMAGSIFAACPESAAETVLVNGEQKKLYAGMASEYVQNKWKGGLKSGTCAEGGVRFLDIGLSLEKLLERYSGALKSGITYAGAADIISFQLNAEFIQI
jgi:IMP dehydrogenase/GMP reductase